MVIPVQKVRENTSGCNICNRHNAEGIWLIGGFICSDCLDEISKTDVHDPRYTFFVRKLKELWRAG